MSQLYSITIMFVGYLFTNGAVYSF